MFRTLSVLLLCAFLLLSTSQVHAFDLENHKGSYLYLMGGFMRASHDTNLRTATPQTFGSALVPAFGLTYGHNITDWIAPEIQFSYGTATGQTPSGSSREHLLTIRLNAKYSFLTNSGFNKNGGLKIYPYAKVGGLAHALYVNAPNTNDKVGAYGGGVGLGGGVEFNYKVLYFGVDVSNDLVFLQEQRRTILGTDTIITNGGFSYQPSVMGAVGVHF
jgi:hypothetical protein